MKSLAATLRPSWIVWVFLFSLLLGGFAVTVGNRTPLILYFDLVFAVVLAAATMRWLLGRFSNPIEDRFMFRLLIVYTIMQVLSTLVNLRDPFRSIFAIKVSLFGGITYFIVLRVVRSRRELWPALYAVAAFGVAISVWLAYLWLTVWSSDLNKDLVGVAFGNSNYIASILVPVLPLCVGLMIRASGRIRILLLVASGIILLGLIITMSRGAYLSLILATFFALPWMLKRGFKVKHLAITIVVLAAIYAALPTSLVEINEEMIQYRLENPDQGREHLLQVSWAKFLQNPLFGVGPNSMYVFMDELYSHNTVLQALSETGLAGAIPFFFMIGAVWLRSFRSARKFDSDPEYKNVSLSFLIGITATLVHGMVEPTFSGPQYAIVFWTLAALQLRLGTVAAYASATHSLVTSPFSHFGSSPPVATNWGSVQSPGPPLAPGSIPRA